jgi:Lon protease-like protein
MQPESPPNTQPKPEHAPAVEHVSRAHELLQALRKRIGEHPELAEAVVNLETALSILTVKTGGML